MIFFEVSRNSLLALGIDPNELYQFNWKIAMGFFLSGLSILSNIVSIFSIENSNQLLLKTFCAITASIQMGVDLLAIVLQAKAFFEGFERIEKIINESILFTNTNWLFFYR